MITHIKQ